MKRTKLLTQSNPIQIFTARCTLVQSAVLRSHVVCLSVCLSVRLSVTLVDCDHIQQQQQRCHRAQDKPQCPSEKNLTKKLYKKLTKKTLNTASSPVGSAFQLYLNSKLFSIYQSDF